MTRTHYAQRCSDRSGEWLEVWHCQPPPPGVWYAVLRQEWNDDLSVRHIHEIAEKENA